MSALYTVIGPLFRPGAEALADRLLERISCRADALVLRAALVELGARVLFEDPGAPGAARRG